MNKNQFRERESTIEKFQALNRNTMDWSMVEKLVDKLHRYETTLHRIAEIQCSVEMSEEVEARIAKKEENTEKKIKAIAQKLGFEVDFNGDPRGGAIRFRLPDRSSNNWDGETWGIY